MTNLESVLKSRDITLLKKFHSQSYSFFSCESWTIRKAEHQRIDAFELWCWRRLLRVPWTARRSNQSILKEISPDYSLQGLMLKLKLQYLGYLMCRTDSLEKPWCWDDWVQEKKGTTEGWNGWMALPTWWTWVWASSWIWWSTRKASVLQSIGLQRVGHNWVTELNWTKLSVSMNLRRCHIWQRVLANVNKLWMLGWKDYSGLSRVSPMGPFSGKAEGQCEKKEIWLLKQWLEWFITKEGPWPKDQDWYQKIERAKK